MIDFCEVFVGYHLYFEGDIIVIYGSTFTHNAGNWTFSIVGQLMNVYFSGEAEADGGRFVFTFVDEVVHMIFQPPVGAYFLFIFGRS